MGMMSKHQAKSAVDKMRNGAKKLIVDFLTQRRGAT
jgi:hypothetical protein